MPVTGEDGGIVDKARGAAVEAIDKAKEALSSDETDNRKTGDDTDA